MRKLKSQLKVRRTIFIVEDEQSLRGAIEQFLTQKGYAVIAVEDGLAALKRLRTIRKPPDLLLSDVSLPQMNGYSLLHQIRKLHPRIPIVVLTGYDEESVRQNLNLTVDVIMKKPFRLQDLGGVIQNILPKEE